MDAKAHTHANESPPSADQLVALARERLNRELHALPPPGSVARRAALYSGRTPDVSFGALTHAIRTAMRSGQEAEAHSLFVVLLRRIESLNRRWLASVLWSLPTRAPERREWTQDLAQELTLLLWKEIGLRDNEAWELFFQRALAYAQGHVASAYLQRQGLRINPRAKRPERGPALVFSRLLEQSDERDKEEEIVDDGSAPLFARADLADLRALVVRLPSRERLAVVMRYWQQAPEAEIAEALGGVTTRAVRYILRRAHNRLRAWYAGEEFEQPDVEEVADAH